MSPRQDSNTRHKLRTIDFKRDKTDVPGKVTGIQYDPNHRLYLARIHYADGEERYILAPQGLEVGHTIKAGDKAEIRPGNALPLSRIPVGTLIHNIELNPKKGGQLVRIAGGAAKLISKDGRYAQIRLPSGILRPIPLDCLATIGQIRHTIEKKVEPAKKEIAPVPAPTPGAIIEPQPAAVTGPPVAVIPELPAAVITEPRPAVPAQPALAPEVPAPPPPPAPAVSPIMAVLPPSGKPGDIFKVIIAGCTPKHKVIIHGEKYSTSSGWQPWYKSCKTDANGNASTTISWKYKGRYDVWAVDEATGLETRASTVVIQYPPIRLALEVSPASGPAGSLFKVNISGGTPKHKLSLHGQKYSPSSGWQLWHKVFKIDRHGKASITLSWRYKGEYNLWAVDEATGVETRSATVVVR